MTRWEICFNIFVRLLLLFLLIFLYHFVVVDDVSSRQTIFNVIRLALYGTKLALFVSWL